MEGVSLLPTKSTSAFIHSLIHSLINAVDQSFNEWLLCFLWALLLPEIKDYIKQRTLKALTTSSGENKNWAYTMKNTTSSFLRVTEPMAESQLKQLKVKAADINGNPESSDRGGDREGLDQMKMD